MITDITAKVRADCRKEALGIMDGATEHVDTEPQKYFHVVITASFSPDFHGVLRLEISNKRSGFYTYQIMDNPPREMLAKLEPGDRLCVCSPGIRVGRMIGDCYRSKAGEPDYVNVRLFLDNEEIVNKDFAVRRTCS